MRAPEEDRRSEHGILLGDVRRAGSLHCLPRHVEPTTALSARISQLAATSSRPNLPQSCSLRVSRALMFMCARVAHVCRTTLRAGGSATARSSTGSAGSSLCCLAAIDIAAVPYARGTRTGLPRRAWLRRRQLGACRLRTACRGTAGPPYTKPDPDPDPDQVLLLRRGGREPQGSPRRREP